MLFLRGRVASPDGTPLAGVELDVWQADAAGHNSNIHPNMPEWNLRGRFHSGSDGTFEARTIVPAPYEIPKGGPDGRRAKRSWPALLSPTLQTLDLSSGFRGAVRHLATTVGIVTCADEGGWHGMTATAVTSVCI